MLDFFLSQMATELTQENNTLDLVIMTRDDIISDVTIGDHLSFL